MDDIRRLSRFVRPYWRRSLAALVLLTSLVFADLSIPRLIWRISESVAPQVIGRSHVPLLLVPVRASIA